MLSGKTWRRLHPRVWVHRDHIMTHHDDIAAAIMTMPKRSVLSHVSRIQMLGLDIGAHRPIHFTVSGDLHIDTEGVFLHRTEVLPPSTDRGVCPAAAFVQMCATSSLMDAVIAGDWLVANKHMSVAEALQVAYMHRWRPGALQAPVPLRLVNGRSRSPRETQVRLLMAAAGLPTPEVNADVYFNGMRIAIVDLLIPEWQLALEYEGRQHALNAAQFGTDIKRYAALRQAGFEYIQITNEMIQQPRALMIQIHQVLTRRGYDGPPPTFGARWNSLHRTIVPPPQPRGR